MKLISKGILVSFFSCVSLAAAADDANAVFNQQTSTNTGNLIQYLQNWAAFLGYDITRGPTITVKQTLLSSPLTQVAQAYVYRTFFGALPVNSISPALSQFIPNTSPGAGILNPLANTTFIQQQFSSPASSAGSQQGVTVSPLIDQQTYQQDPVSQSILNILGTPDFSYCMSYDGSSWEKNCQLLHQNRVMWNVIGPIPTAREYSSYAYNQQLIGQLNMNSLLSPMLYSTDNPEQNTTGSPTPNKQNPGLTAQNQAQEAANFIRYASGAVAPTNLPKLQAYDELYNQAIPPLGSNNVTQLQQIQAQSMLTNFFANLRIFAAQNSVGVGNLYYILSRRLPQNEGTGRTIYTSQALSEFKMATWRLFNPDFTSNKQWIDQINSASSATVQKEIVTLLAEINYQMYLDRQLQERMLLTNSIMLIQNTKASQPSADFQNQTNNADFTNTGLKR